jgi:hypothetical protein
MTFVEDGNQPWFDADFTRGKVGENLVDTFLYALEGGTIEVKTDYQVTKTGKFYIEFEQWSKGRAPKPSGISTTRSTHWVLASPTGIGGVLVETSWLRRLIFEGDNIFTTGSQSIANDKTNGSTGYLIPAKHVYEQLSLFPLKKPPTLL